MPIKVRYFASLQDAMGKHEEILNLDEGASTTVSAVWARVSGEDVPLGHLLCAVNMEYASPDAPVRDGDEVAFFPPVTGG